MTISRIKIKRALVVCNDIHGKGVIRAVVYADPYAGVTPSILHGLVVRQFQYGMDAVQFTVADDCKTIRFLQHTRPVL